MQTLFKLWFENTLAAAEYMVPGERKLVVFFEKYMAALNYQRCRNEGSVGVKISDETEL